jgi:lysophospholipase L1-like esterase
MVATPSPQCASEPRAHRVKANSAADRARTRRRRLTRIALVAGSFAFGLVLLEGAARVMGLRVPARGASAPVVLIEAAPQEVVPGVRFALIPNASATQLYPGITPAEDRVVHYRINEHGFRGPSIDLARKPGRPRIAVFGDSFTYGTAIDHEDTFPALLAERFAATGRDVEVLNLGVYAYNARQSVYAFAHWQPRLQPDIALLVLYINDASGGALQRPTDESDRRDPRLAWIHRLGLTSGVWSAEDEKTPAQARMMWLRERSVLVDRAAHVLYRRWMGEITRESYRADWADGAAGREMVRQSLAAAARVARERGVELHVAMYPDLLTLGPPYAFEAQHRTVAALCQEAGLPFHDLTPLFAGRRPAALVAHAHDHHPNGHANRLVAEHLAELFTPAVDAVIAEPPLALR